MNRRDFLSAAAALSLPGATASAAARKPNFVFIFTDDHHYQAFGANGNPKISTPNMDRIARSGVHFVNGQISTSQCAPSRGILLSGLETIQSGLKSNGTTSFRSDVGPTVIQQLRDAGYDTTLVGKWHIRNTPAQCGFANAPLWLKSGSSKYIDPTLTRGLPGQDGAVKGHITELFTDAATAYIRDAKGPFFLWLAYNAPHSPWTARPETKAKYGGSREELAPPDHPRDAKPFDWTTYYAVITELDAAIGRVLKQIEDSKQWDNTVIVLLGDNGFMCGARGLGGKVVPWEQSVRVPFAIAGGPVKKGVRHMDPAASIDLPATWLDFAGVRPKTPLAGRSLVKLLTTGSGGPTDAFTVWDDGRPEALSVRQAIEPFRLVRTAKHKLIVWESKKQAMYDHASDPGETKNLIDDPAHKRTADDLRARLRARMKATNDHAIAWLG